MSKRALEWKVGVFVAIALALGALLIMRFSKGGGLFTPTYVIHLQAHNVGGIIPGAAVVLSGVPIGTIIGIDLGQDGRTVLMHAKIQKTYRVRKDADFGIKSASFLGDKYISVTPPSAEAMKKKAELLTDGDVVQCEEPYDFVEVARSASGLMQRLEQTVIQLNTAVARLDTNVLSVGTLTNLTGAIANFRLLSERALVAVENVDSFVRTNTPALSVTITNFGLFTDKLNKVTFALQETLATNRDQLFSAIQNVDKATEKLDALLENVQQGKGLAGALLNNQEMANHVSIIASNFAVLSSNVNHKGLWGVFRKPKESKEK
jgi:phospholipid/cholesterol/gamma-HCH transport system substrate-binding protein